MSAITLGPLAGALKDVLQKHERIVLARAKVADARRASSSVRDIALPAAEQELRTAGVALDAVLLEYSAQIEDLVERSKA